MVGTSCFDFIYPEDMDEAKKCFELNKNPNANHFVSDSGVKTASLFG